MQRKHRIEGVIIKRRNIGEADRLLTIFTPFDGKLTVKASGVRKIPSRRGPHIELLNRSEIGLYKGAGMPVLTDARVVEEYRGIKDDLGKIGFAYHMCELIDGLVPENQEHTDIYHLFQHSLKRLDDNNDIAVIIHDFEVELLRILGFWKQTRERASLVELNDYIETILERKLKSRKVIASMRKQGS